MCNITLAVDAGDFTGAEFIYNNGFNTPKKIVDMAYRVSQNGDQSALSEAWYSAGAAFFDNDPNWLDTYISDAFEDEGFWSGEEEAQSQGAKKGIQYMTQVAFMNHYLERVGGLLSQGNTTDALHVIDEAYALYAGNGCNDGNIYVNAEKRGPSYNFTTSTSEGTCVSKINVAMVDAFNALQGAALAGDQSAADEAYETIKQQLFASFVQSTLVYANNIEDILASGNSSELAVESAEGLTFFLTIMPLLSEQTARVISDQFLEPSPGIYENIKSELESVYADIGVTSADVGELQSTPVSNPNCVPALPTAVSAAFTLNFTPVILGIVTIVTLAV